MTRDCSNLYVQRATLRAYLDDLLARKAQIENEIDAIAKKLDTLNIEIAAGIGGHSAAAEKQKRYSIVKSDRLTLLGME